MKQQVHPAAKELKTQRDVQKFFSHDDITIVGFFDPDTGRITFVYIAGVFQNPIYMEGLGNSLRIATGTTFLALCISLPLAWLSNRYTFPGKRIVNALLLVPMILPPLICWTTYCLAKDSVLPFGKWQLRRLTTVVFLISTILSRYAWKMMLCLIMCIKRL